MNNRPWFIKPEELIRDICRQPPGDVIRKVQYSLKDQWKQIISKNNTIAMYNLSSFIHMVNILVHTEFKWKDRDSKEWLHEGNIKQLEEYITRRKDDLSILGIKIYQDFGVVRRWLQKTYDISLDHMLNGTPRDISSERTCKWTICAHDSYARCTHIREHGSKFCARHIEEIIG